MYSLDLSQLLLLRCILIGIIVIAIKQIQNYCYFIKKIPFGFISIIWNFIQARKHARQSQTMMDATTRPEQPYQTARQIAISFVSALLCQPAPPARTHARQSLVNHRRAKLSLCEIFTPCHVMIFEFTKTYSNIVLKVFELLGKITFAIDELQLPNQVFMVSKLILPVQIKPALAISAGLGFESFHDWNVSKRVASDRYFFWPISGLRATASSSNAVTSVGDLVSLLSNGWTFFDFLGPSLRFDDVLGICFIGGTNRWLCNVMCNLY